VKRALAVVALALAGCNANVRFDPEGYRCDPGGVCPNGYTCVLDVCRRAGTGPCDGFVCDEPPAAVCADATTLRTFPGRCDSGSGQPMCLYEPSDTACPGGCAAGACVDPCANVTCLTPPSAACADANTLRTYAQTGTCSGGTCSYASTDVNCPNGCAGGVCMGADLCAGKTCTTPPAPVCMGNVQRTFASTGTCEPSTGQCQYAAIDVTCSGGCNAGACVVPAAAFAQVGPRVRFAITAIDQAPNSGGNNVVAVGAGGRIARWNGSSWTEVANTPSTARLNRVHFVTGTLAYIVGDNKTVWAYRPGANSLLASTIPGNGNAKLVGLSGRGESDVLVADDSGTWWHLTSTGWQTGNLPGGDGPFVMTSAFLDESGRERIAGTCGGQSCIAYRFPGGATPNWLVDTRSDALGFDALGGSFDAPSSLTSEALAGQSDDALFGHSNIGTFTAQSVAPALTGGGVVGITAQSSSSSAGRQVYVLTSSSGQNVGHLYRLSRSGSTVTATVALDTYMGREVLSPTEATGVIVAEVNDTAGSNNIFRRSIVVDQALDVGEDLAGASLDAAGTLALASIYGDVATLASGAATYHFQRPPVDLVINAVESRRGTGVLIAGRLSNGGGAVYRVLPASGYTQLGTTAAGVTWNALCRVSDTEGWVVGTGGAIGSVTASGVTSVASPTTKDLLAVDCAPGFAAATGLDGTVLVFAQGQWSVAPLVPNVTKALTGVGLAGRVVFVAGDNVFAKLDTGAWTTLPARTGMKGLVVRGPADVYGTVINGNRSDIVRFDGAQWSASLLQVNGVLGGGVQVGARVVWGGSAGVVVEGR
jgi:hypothetical protein